MDGLERAANIAAECASPTRLAVLKSLHENGPTRVRVLSELTGIAESTLSNHLRRLREKELVAVVRDGKTATYSVAEANIGDVLASLFHAAGMTQNHNLVSPESHLGYARSCYDHLAGAVGVQLTQALFDKGAIIFSGKDITLGPNAETCFAFLGTGLTGLDNNRKFAFLCPDWSHDQEHLAGALGSALLQGLVSKGWISHVSNSREISVTQSGQKALEEFIGEPLGR